MQEEKFDLLLFGATGLVGRYGIEHLHNLTKGTNLRWAVAGRDYSKVQKVLQELEARTGDSSVIKIPIILADMSDEVSIIKMTSRTKVLINACGPLRANGEVVVKSCVETGTHYVDVSAEENFMDKILLKYREKGEKAGIYIVNACGLDCLVFEMGILYLQERFPGTLNSAEVFVKTGSDDYSLEGPTGNSSTWRSAIDLMLNKKELKELKSKLNIKTAPILGPELKRRSIPFRPSEENGWAIVLASSDRPTMLRTQQFLHEESKIHPVQIETYMVLDKFWHLFGLIAIGVVFMSLVFFKAGRWLLLRYPHIFTAGYFGTTEPTREKSEDYWARLTFAGKGWKGRKLNSGEKFEKPVDHAMTLQVRGRNPGYGMTALCLVSAGLMMATEQESMPKQHGVLTSGAAFRNTSLVDVLKKNGVSFEITNEYDI